MRAARASGKVKRSGRGYITASGGSAKKKTSARPSMRSGQRNYTQISCRNIQKNLLLKENPVPDQVEDTSDVSIVIFYKINTSWLIYFFKKYILFSL